MQVQMARLEKDYRTYSSIYLILVLSPARILRTPFGVPPRREILACWLGARRKHPLAGLTDAATTPTAKSISRSYPSN